MAHIEKYQGSAIGKLCGHYNRWADFPGHGVERENIDPSRTPENYNLGPERDCTQVEFINRRIASLDLKRAPRKDAVRMVDTVVTLPGTYHGDVREFFEAVRDTLDEIFGAENCVSAWVHMDERTPHMHYASVPVTEDGRLSAKSLLTRTFMRRFHDRLEDGVCERLGIERAGLTLTEEEREQRAGRYVSLPEYKAAQDAVRAAQEQHAELLNEVADLQGDLVELDNSIEDKRFELQDLGEQVEQENRRLESVRLEPTPQTVSESLRTLWEARNDGGREGRLASEIEGLRSRVSELEGANRAARERVAELDRELPGLRGRYRELERRFEALEQRVTAAIGRLREVPETLSGWALGIARKLGVRTYNPNSLDYQMRSATEAARAINGGRDFNERGRGFSR